MYLKAALPPPPEAIWSAIEHGRMHHGSDEERAREWGRLKAKGVKVGLPDVFGVWCFKFFAIELKAGRNDTSAAQDQFAAAWRANGGLYFVCRSVAEVDAALRSMSLPVHRSMAIAAAGHDAALSVPAPAKKDRARRWREQDLAEDGKRRLEEFLDEI
jgi:hypothetical protein